MSRFRVVLALAFFSLLSASPVVKQPKPSIGDSHAKTKAQNLPPPLPEETGVHISGAALKESETNTQKNPTTSTSQPGQATTEVNKMNPKNSGISTQGKKHSSTKKIDGSQLQNFSHSITTTTATLDDPAKLNKTDINLKDFGSNHRAADDSTKNNQGIINKKLSCYLELYEIAHLLVQEQSSLEDSSPHKIRGDNNTIYKQLLKLMMRVIERKQSRRKITAEPRKPTNKAAINEEHKIADTLKKLQKKINVETAGKTGQHDQGTNQKQNKKKVFRGEKDFDKIAKEPEQKINEKNLNTQNNLSKSISKTPHIKEAPLKQSEDAAEEVKANKSSTLVKQIFSFNTKTPQSNANSDPKPVKNAETVVETKPPAKDGKKGEVSKTNIPLNSDGSEQQRKDESTTLTPGDIGKSLNSNPRKKELPANNHEASTSTDLPMAGEKIQHSAPSIHGNIKKRQKYHEQVHWSSWDW